MAGLMKKPGLFVVAAGLSLMSIGCALNNNQDYEARALSLPVTSGRTIAVGTQDQRPLVVKGPEREHYVGHQRGGYGNPFLVTTKDLKPLAGVVTNVVKSALQQKGAKVTPVALSPRTSTGNAHAAFAATKADRWMMISMKEWDSDTYVNTDLDYDLLVQVFDGEGKLLASNELKEKDTIKSPALGGGVHSELIPEAFKQRMEELLSDPKIVAALQ